MPGAKPLSEIIVMGNSGKYIISVTAALRNYTTLMEEKKHG